MQNTESPLTGVHVQVKSDSVSRGTTSGDDSATTVANVPFGTYELHVTYVGYAAHVDTLQIDFKEEHTFRINLESDREELDEVVIDSDGEPFTPDIEPSRIRIRPAYLQRVPMPDVSPDLMAFLVTRPDLIEGDLFLAAECTEFQQSWLYGFAGYSLSFADYWDSRLTARSAASFIPPHDRRHQLNVMAQASSGPYRLSVRWQDGSGIPFTPIRSYFIASPPASTSDRSFLTNPGTVELSFATP